MHTATVEDFEAALDVMFWGVLYPMLAVLAQMRARHRGRIVTVTSIGGMVSVPHLLPYTCAKFAAVGLSEGLRAELGREGMHVTTIVPGLILFPGTTTNLLSAVNSLLPGANGASATSAPGMEVQQRMHSRRLDLLTSLGRAAAHRLHQYPPVAVEQQLSAAVKQQSSSPAERRTP